MRNDACGALATRGDDRDVLAFLALTTTLSTPFWVLSSASGRQLLPGLPLSALMTVCPLAAAALLTYHRTGREGVTTLLGRALDMQRVPSRSAIVQLSTWAGRSVFATVLFHASDNLSVFLSPRAGSHYDPRTTAILLTIATVAAAAATGNVC